MRKNRPDDYLRMIYQICERSPDAIATTGVLAMRMGVSDGTASTIVKQLAKAGLVVYQPYGGAQLTQQGLLRALGSLRRQRLLELFLARTLGMPWEQISDEAERLETCSSDELIERIDVHLGHPEFDPHGDPIPRSDGTLPTASQVALAGCSPGTGFVVTRVLDQSTETLRYLAEAGIAIGLRGQITDNTSAGGIVTISTSGGSFTISRTVAAKIVVSVESTG